MELYGMMFTSELDMQHVKKVFAKSNIFGSLRKRLRSH